MRKARELVRDIADGARQQPGRTLLAFIALAIGSSVIALLTAVVTGLQERASRLISEFGASLVALVPASPSKDAEGVTLTERTVEILEQNLPAALVAGVRHLKVPAGGGQTPVVLACDAQLARVRGWSLVAGRFLDARDLSERARVAVLSAPLAAARGLSAGAYVDLAGTPFEVVGIVDCRTVTLSAAIDRTALAPGEQVVFVPRTSLLEGGVFGRESDCGLDAVFVRLPEDDRYSAARARLARLLSDPRLGGPAVTWIEPETILQGVRRWGRALDWGGGALAALGWAMGGLLLASLLAENVRARTVEIGLRRALGATRGDIAALFVGEGLMVSVTAALVGAAAAHLTAARLSEFAELPLRVDARLWLAPMAVAVATGILASWLPSQAAARLAPAAALRAE